MSTFSTFSPHHTAYLTSHNHLFIPFHTAGKSNLCTHSPLPRVGCSAPLGAQVCVSGYYRFYSSFLISVYRLSIHPSICHNMASLLSISTPSATLTFSDIDSDAAAAILHRPTHRRPTTTRTTHHPPTPGTRRFRRHLNALLSADEGGGSSSDYYSATSDGEGREEGEPEVWRSEWRGEFVRVGEEFFEGRVGIARVGRAVGEEEKGSRLQRRVKTIEKERLERRRERRERLERKQRRLAATDQLTTSASSNASSPVMAGSGVEDGSLAGLRAQREGGGARLVQDDFVMVDAEAEVDGKVERAEDGEQPQEEDELMMTNVIAGDGQWQHTFSAQLCWCAA